MSNFTSVHLAIIVVVLIKSIDYGSGEFSFSFSLFKHVAMIVFNAEKRKKESEQRAIVAFESLPFRHGYATITY